MRLPSATVAGATALFVLAAPALLSAPTATAAPRAGAGQPAPTADVWVTTVDGAERLRQREDVVFGTAASDAPTIVVDPDTGFQSMDGFGASITDSSAAVLHRLAPAARDAALRSLFDPEEGIGISFLRQPIGSSDFTAEAEHYTYDDVAPGQTDFPLAQFSIAHDEAQILPLLRRAKQLNPRLTVMATPWSPPAWMKEGDSLVGGRLKDDPAVYQAYARYLVRFVEAYAAAGVPVDLLSVQNEPQNRAPLGYPGADMPVRQQVAVIEALGPLLQEASPRTKVLAYDHNWAVHPDDVRTTPPGSSPEADYPYDVLDSPAARWVDGTAYHCYYGDPSAQSALHDAHPDKDIWFTECSGSHSPTDAPAKVFAETLKWHSRNLVVGTTRNWAKSVVNWNIALDEQGGPYNGGCTTCSGQLTIGADGTVTRNAEYYTIGHLSKFVDPGATRIDSTSFGTTGWNGQVMDVAFRNPDGSTVLVVHNENDDPRAFAVQVGGRTFEYTAPGGALLTFTWERSPQLGQKLRAVPLDGATATASPAGEGAERAVDGDASTRWSSGTGQQPGHALTIDLGARTHFRTVAVDSGGNLGDFARSWELSASDDGVTWRTLRTGTSTGQLTTIDVGNQTARHLRVTSTGSSGSWWSIADVRLYR